VVMERIWQSGRHFEFVRMDDVVQVVVEMSNGRTSMGKNLR